jgi:uncharacterized protein YbjT (DUF2867 family)
MIPSIFATLCDVADALDRSIRDLPAGPERDTLADLGRRLDAVIDRLVGVPEVHQAHPREDESA